MTGLQQHVKLAQALPSSLLQLFKRFPPQQLAPAAASIQSASESITTAENTSSSDPNATITTSAPLTATKKSNPFLPWKNPRTGNWHGPHYSLRRQADLFKLAVKHDVLPLMPLSPKHPEVKEKKRLERGLKVQGTGVGKKVKGKKWERTLKPRLEARRQAMEGMPELIKKWRQSGRGWGWKKWPK